MSVLYTNFVFVVARFHDGSREGRTMMPAPDGSSRLRRGVFGWLLAVLLGVSGVVAGSPAAVAYEASTGTWSPPASGTSTLAFPSGVTATVAGSGATSVIATPRTLGYPGFAADFYTPTMAATDSSLEVRTVMATCEIVGTCSDLGTVTVTFNRPVRNPTLHIAGLGGASFLTRGTQILTQSDQHATLRLVTPGVTLEQVSGNSNFAVRDNMITAADHSASLSCVTNTTSVHPANASASCGSVRVLGTVTTLTFEAGAEIVKNALAPAPADRTPIGGDSYFLTVSLGQDFSSGPVSYAGSQAPGHALSDVSLGRSVSEDHAGVRNPVGPAAGDVTDAFSSLPVVVGEPGMPYRVSVPVSGVSSPAHVCGFLDLDRDGSFNTGAERACAAVAAGASSAALEWTVPAGVSLGKS